MHLPTRIENRRSLHSCPGERIVFTKPLFYIDKLTQGSNIKKPTGARTPAVAVPPAPVHDLPLLVDLRGAPDGPAPGVGAGALVKGPAAVLEGEDAQLVLGANRPAGG